MSDNNDNIDLRHIKLVNREEIIAEFVGLINETIQLRRPMMVHTFTDTEKQAIYFTNWIQMCDNDDTDVFINTNHIICNKSCKHDLIQRYEILCSDYFSDDTVDIDWKTVH